jgi:hypothetical protein
MEAGRLSKGPLIAIACIYTLALLSVPAAALDASPAKLKWKVLR